MAQEFSKLNGYLVKDATARQQISDLTTQHNTDKQGLQDQIDGLEVQTQLATENFVDAFSRIAELETESGQAETDISNLTERVTDIENKTYNQLTSESTSDDFEDALDAYNDNAVPIVYIDNNNIVCSLISAFDMAEDAAPVCHFLNAQTKEIIGVSNLGSTLNFTRKNLDNPISISYVEADEELTIGE